MTQPRNADVAVTRLQPPKPPPHLVSRKTILAALQQALAEDQKLILVSAPAGSGKTTTVADWVSQQQIPAAWYHVDRHDNDPARFWAHVVAALRVTLPDLAARLTPDLPALAGQKSDVVATLVNTLATEPALLIVLDDFHLIKQPAIHDTIAELIPLLPEHIHLVLLTRFDPAISVGRLRAQHQVCELRYQDLAFDAAEAAELIHANAPNADAAHLNALHDRTEGWAVGLVLAGLAARSTPDLTVWESGFHGRHHFVQEYLRSEFFDHLDRSERELLHKIALVGEVHGDLLDAILGTTDGAEQLAKLAASNQLLIRLGPHEQWYRLHHLVNDMLTATPTELTTADVAAVHAAAAHWHLKQQRWLPAFDAFLKAAQLPDAADVLVAHGTWFYNHGQVDTLVELLNHLEPIHAERRDLLIFSAWTAMLQGHLDQAGDLITTARQMPGTAVEDQLLTSLEIMHPILLGDVQRAVVIPAGTAPFYDAAVPMAAGCAGLFAGQWETAAKYLAEALRCAHHTGDNFVVVSSWCFQAVLAWEQQVPTEAAKCAAKALEFAESMGLTHLTHLSLAHAVTAVCSAPGDTALMAARLARRSAETSAELLISTYALALVAQVYHQQGEPDAQVVLAEAQRRIAGCVDPGISGGRVRATAELVVAPTVVPAAAAEQPLVVHLTAREVDVLNLLPTSLSQRDIAARLHVSMNTVKTHIAAVYRKLGASGRAEAVQLARSKGLL